MTLTPRMFLIVCPLLFLAGFVDSIGGGGGLISLPAYLFAGLPVHAAVATNKLSSACGTSVVTARFIKNGLVNFRVLIRWLLLPVLPIAAFFVLNRHLFPDRENAPAVADRRTILVCVVSALIIGVYDGFYGPGTGTFLIIAFTVFAKMSVGAANAQAKVINLTTNLTSLAVFLASGQVVVALGLAAAACNMLGGYVGAGLAMEKGAKITRPTILIVLLLLLFKILTER